MTTTSHERPNILLITSDQQRFDTTGPHAPAFMRTPHTDRLAFEGVRFSAAYSDCPICIPARVSMMTGKYAHHHGVTRGQETSTSGAMGRRDTLPGLLRNLDYQTIAVGKMHFGPMRARHGFDEMILPDDYYREMHRSGSPYQPMRHGLDQTELYPSLATVPESMTLTSWIAEKCVEFILERRDPTAPFFMWCSHPKPHPPLDPPEPYYSMYRHATIPDPVCGDWSGDDRCPQALKRFRQRKSYDLMPPEIIREARSAYYGLITHIDYTIGRVIAALSDAKLLDNTLIVYTSDHGEYLGDHHCGSKVFFHEPSAHVPMIVRMPKTWDARCHGTTVDALVTHADLLPTFIRAAGGTPPDGVDGQDLIALARGEAEPRPYLEAMSTQYSACDYLAITDGRWKYIWYPEGAQEQLFDLATDPQELHDLGRHPDHADQRRILRTALVERHQARGSRYVENGNLLTLPLQETSAEDNRNNTLWVWSTDYHRSERRH